VILFISKHKRAKEKIESARGHSKARRFVDAIDDAGLVMDQYRSLDMSIKETMVRATATSCLSYRRLKFSQLGAILSTEFKLAVSHPSPTSEPDTHFLPSGATCFRYVNLFRPGTASGSLA
jgi:hypothetical protein